MAQSKEYLELELAYEKESNELDSARDEALKKKCLKTLIFSTSLKPHSTYGDLMPIEDFIDCVNSGGFIDYDGSGNYATATQESDIAVYPSDIKKEMYRKDFSHIMWYNK